MVGAPSHVRPPQVVGVLYGSDTHHHFTAANPQPNFVGSGPRRIPSTTSASMALFMAVGDRCWTCGTRYYIRRRHAYSECTPWNVYTAVCSSSFHHAEADVDDTAYMSGRRGVYDGGLR